MNITHDQLLIKVSKLYFEDGFNQSFIANKLGISRPYVSKLLIEAKQTGIVSILIRDPLNNESYMESIIRNHYQLKKVLIAESSLCEDAVAAVAKKAAQWIDTIIKSNDIIALGWGRTMYLMTQNLKKRTDLSQISVVSLYGMQPIMHENVYNIEGLIQMTEMFKASNCYALTVPAIVSSIEIKKQLLHEKSIAQVIDMLHKSNIAAFTIGTPRRSSFLGSVGALSESEFDHIRAKGAVCECCLHLLNDHAEIVSEEIDSRTITLPLSDIKKKEYRIAVAAGRSKIDAIDVALKSGCINVLVTDEDVAKEIVSRIGKKEE